MSRSLLTSSNMDSEPEPLSFEGYSMEHQIVQESPNFVQLELESNEADNQKRSLIQKRYTRDKFPETCVSFHKVTETWTSIPVQGRFISAKEAAYSALPGRRLSFSTCSGDTSSVTCLNCSSEDIFSTSIDDEQSAPETFSFDETDLKLENVDLKHQLRKQRQDYEDILIKLREAEDHNSNLEIQIQKTRLALSNTQERYERETSEHKFEVDRLTDSVLEIKEQIGEKSSRLARLEKERHGLEGDRVSLQEELDKASSEVQWYHKSNKELKKEIFETSKAYEAQLSIHIENFSQLELKNCNLSLEVDQLRISNEKLEREKSELELTARRSSSFRYSKATTVFNNENGCEDDEGGVTSEFVYHASFPGPQFGKSIFEEIQTSQQLQKSESATSAEPDRVDISTQTDEIVQTINETILDNGAGGHTSVTGVNILRERTSNQYVTEGQVRCKKNKKPGWMIFPIDNRKGTGASMGIVPDEDKERMLQNAFDVPLRSCNPAAAILSRREWRTLNADLNQNDLDQFKKTYGQEEEVDEVGWTRATIKSDDLDELAETYIEQFPFLAETLFNSLKSIGENRKTTIEEYPALKKRFEELANTFRTEHDTHLGRFILAQKSYENAKSRVSETSSLLREAVTKIRCLKMSGELRELFNSVQTSIAEIDIHNDFMERAAQRTGRLDILDRTFRMIEVMVLYLRILQQKCADLDRDRQIARDLLTKRGINISEELGRLYGITTDRMVGPTTRSRCSEIHNGGESLVSGDPAEESGNETLLGSGERTSQMLITRILKKAYESLRRELCWPWTGDQTWVGIRKIFAILLMFCALLLIFGITFPSPSCGGTFDWDSLFTFTYLDPPRT